MVTMLFALFVGCDDTNFNSHSAEVEVEIEVEGIDAVIEIFDAHCPVCHEGDTPSAGLALDGDLCENLVGIETESGTLVKAGDAPGSVLIDRIIDAENPMPPVGLMDQVDIDIITEWVEAGAVCDADSAPDPNPDDTTDANVSSPGGTPE